MEDEEQGSQGKLSLEVDQSSGVEGGKNTERRILSWNFSLFGCCGSCGTCLCSFIFPCLMWPRTTSRISTGIHCLFFFLVYTLLWVVAAAAAVIAAGVVARKDVYAYTAFIAGGAALLVMLLAGYWRRKLREKGQISGNLLLDVCTHCWCHPCAITQEARQIDAIEERNRRLVSY